MSIVIAMTLNEVARVAHDTAVIKGFWDGDAADVAKKLLLIHSEVSEAAEELRRDGRTDSPGAEDAGRGEHSKQGLPSELADVLIRTLDLMQYLNIDVDAAVFDKLKYNEQRPFKHGKKF